MTAELFGNVQEFPDPESGKRFDALVGLDDVKTRLVHEAEVLLSPDALNEWAQQHHGGPISAVKAVSGRSPLIILAGDIGTGKTEIAETVGHPISQKLGIDVTLYPLSLNARGSGLVGQMTTLITQALAEVRSMAEKARTNRGNLNRALILLVDEADSVAQSRELAQMHHEDRAGVNALIQGVDGFRKDRLPVLTILCTNRADAIDPAVARRAAHTFIFERPNDDQRRHILTEAFDDAGISSCAVDKIVSLVGPTDVRPYGVTYSDLRQRFVPDAVLEAFGTWGAINDQQLIRLAEEFVPTRPFHAEDST